MDISEMTVRASLHKLLFEVGDVPSLGVVQELLCPQRSRWSLGRFRSLKRKDATHSSKKIFFFFAVLCRLFKDFEDFLFFFSMFLRRLFLDFEDFFLDRRRCLEVVSGEEITWELEGPEVCGGSNAECHELVSSSHVGS